MNKVLDPAPNEKGETLENPPRFYLANNYEQLFLSLYADMCEDREMWMAYVAAYEVRPKDQEVELDGFGFDHNHPKLRDSRMSYAAQKKYVQKWFAQKLNKMIDAQAPGYTRNRDFLAILLFENNVTEHLGRQQQIFAKGLHGVLNKKYCPEVAQMMAINGKLRTKLQQSAWWQVQIMEYSKAALNLDGHVWT